MPSYDASRFEPAAPVAHVTLRNPYSEAMVADVPLLLDTGADITLLPRAAVATIGVSPLPDQGYELMSFNGSQSVSSVVVLDMLFLKRAFRGRYLLMEAEYGILGRDILNHLALVLDGPQRQWWERDSARS